MVKSNTIVFILLIATTFIYSAKMKVRTNALLKVDNSTVAHNATAAAAKEDEGAQGKVKEVVKNVANKTKAAVHNVIANKTNPAIAAGADKVANGAIDKAADAATNAVGKATNLVAGKRTNDANTNNNSSYAKFSAMFMLVLSVLFL